MARETLRILDRGWYETASGRVRIAREQEAAREGTRLFRPRELEALSCEKTAPAINQKPGDRTVFSVTGEKTQRAAYRLVVEEGAPDLAVLNFASARNIGGGFLRGAVSQEEDLARSSGLYRCLETQPDFYRENRKQGSALYTDHILYSPGVPWFRDADGNLLEGPFLASIITATAPNAREFRKREGGNRERLAEVLVRRTGHVLEVAWARGARSLVLGAWGCGVFGNDPQEVAAAFMAHLKGRRFRDHFASVTFAVFDPGKNQDTYRAFAARVR